MIIYGTKSMVKNLGTIALLALNCCDTESAKNIIRVRKWFTLFFIPLIPYSSKYYIQCVACGAAFETTKHELEQKQLI